jgi:internalin A
MHATHQFFLSKRRLYVLVLDGRKDERPEYWLQHIESFGGDSPVLVVLNKMDSNPSFDVNRPFLREKYPGIRDFFRISCKTGKGLAQFKEALLDALNKVEMIGTVWPSSWFAVKQRLEQMNKPYISAEEYKGICKEAEIADEQGRETLVDFLHDLGVAVHFKDFLLDAMHVLNPAWVTDAVYKIITAEKMAENKGCLCLKCLGELLPQGGDEKHVYPENTYPFIMGLMEKFELCYSVGEGAVLIPQLFPRFMVKVHKDIKAETCWRTGVLLEDKLSGAQALVKADVEARRINICVQGERRREYLHYLRYLMADINSGFEKLKIMELVPMPDAENITADYATLLEYTKNGIDKYIPTSSTKVYSVHELLGLVQPKDKDELMRFADKTGVKPEDKASFWEKATSVVEIKLMPPFINVNISVLFKQLLALDKQRQRKPTT